MAQPIPGTPFWTVEKYGMGPPVQQAVSPSPYDQSTSRRQKVHEETNRQYKEMRDRLAQDMTDQQAMIKRTLLAKTVSTPDKTRDIEIALDQFNAICEKQKREHIWNMIVLSAESS